MCVFLVLYLAPREGCWLPVELVWSGYSCLYLISSGLVGGSLVQPLQKAYKALQVSLMLSLCSPVRIKLEFVTVFTNCLRESGVDGSQVGSASRQQRLAWATARAKSQTSEALSKLVPTPALFWHFLDL